MKKLQDFQGQKMNRNQMNSLLGGKQMTSMKRTYTSDYQCGDISTVTNFDDGSCRIEMEVLDCVEW